MRLRTRGMSACGDLSLFSPVDVIDVESRIDCNGAGRVEEGQQIDMASGSEQRQDATTTGTTSQPDNLISQLERLAELRREGLLSEHEYRVAKARILT